MKNFIYHNPTKIFFGRGMITHITDEIPRDKTVLFLYGGGSIRQNGVYDQVKSALRNHRVLEFGGIEPNPFYETCLQALEMVKDEQVEFILAVGGGSVLDAAKFIAAAACYQGDHLWDILVSGGEGVTSALPIGTVLTLPATGSESNGNSVISRKETSEKRAFFSRAVFPQFSVLDPETTFSLPAKQIRNGIVDSFVHVMEQYMTYPSQTPLQDRFAESILQTLIETAPVTLAEPSNEEARANLMWAATLALNTLIGAGVPQDWSTHMIGHELTALYGLAHAETLAIVLPGLWQYKMNQKMEKLEQYGRRVWKVKSAKAAVKKTEAFFHSIGMPTRFKDYQISAPEAARKVAKRFLERQAAYGEHEDIDAQAAEAILRKRA